jgi:hypothetical protein
MRRVESGMRNLKLHRTQQKEQKRDRHENDDTTENENENPRKQRALFSQAFRKQLMDNKQRDSAYTCVTLTLIAFLIASLYRYYEIKLWSMSALIFYYHYP